MRFGFLEDDSPAARAHAPLFLTSDSVDFNQRLPDGLEAYMKESRCVLALGDGCGLNYATWSSVFAAFVDGISAGGTGPRDGDA
jgi:hypothetical protein